MSSASVTSNMREKGTQELEQELEAIRAMNGSLRAYLDHLHTFKRGLAAMNENCKELRKVNSRWIDMVKNS